MNIQVLWHGLFDGVEEFSELRSAMARKAASDHFSGGDIEGRKKRGRAVTHIVMGMPLHLPRTHGQKRLCAVERLDLALLVDTQYDRSLGRIEVKPDDITHLFDKQRIGRELECAGAMGLDQTPSRGRAPAASKKGLRQTRPVCHNSSTFLGIMTGASRL